MGPSQQSILLSAREATSLGPGLPTSAYLTILDNRGGARYRRTAMKPVVNVGENPGKVVGSKATSATDYDRLVEASQSLMPRLPYPKGAYRFRSHEEADEWMGCVERPALPIWSHDSRMG